MVSRKRVTPAKVARACEALTTAQLAVEALYDNVVAGKPPSLRTVSLRVMGEELRELRRQLQEMFGA